jgi:hypothetical protein
MQRRLFSSTFMEGPSPKHGIIYRHPAVLGTPKGSGQDGENTGCKAGHCCKEDYNGSGLSPN